MTAAYDYLFLTLTQPQPALVAHLKRIAPALAEAGGEIAGLFTPQLGWAGNEAAVLVRWRGGQAGDCGVVAGADIVSSSRTHRLSPTIRPSDTALPLPGGIYVHRWFEVDAGATDEFVTLSGQAWEHFEAKFDTTIFGLFRAEPSDEQRRAGVAPMLLMTRYADHGVWEASRDPTTEAMQIFGRRQQLTRRSWGASTRVTLI